MKIALALVATLFSISIHAKSVTDLLPPEGFQRTNNASGSYGDYLRSLPIRSDNKIALWTGAHLPNNTYSTLAVLDLPLLFNENLEQCADFSMRLWGDYLKQSKKLNELALYDFYGNKKPFSKSGRSYLGYLRWHMAYSNSYSIKLGAKPVRLLSDLQAGDMFVQNQGNEGIGHVSVVIDQAENEFGHKLYLVGYSFMPAQQFHIEKASEEHGIDGWFTADGYERFAKEQFGFFGEPIVMQFERHFD